jgi:DNA-binding MarR family transcriptional regulator
MSESDISLALTPSQVARVLDAAAGGAGLPPLLSNVEQPRELISSPLLEDPKISKSLLLGLVVLVSFPSDGGGRANKDVAGELSLAASTSHRYIQTLVAAGLLEQDPLTREYRRTVLSHRGGGKSRGRR